MSLEPGNHQVPYAVCVAELDTLGISESAFVGTFGAFDSYTWSEVMNWALSDEANDID